jgi:cardiolipin synthase
MADGSYVQLYKDGEALQVAYKAIENAHSRVCLEVYIFADDPTGKAFAELLTKKARSGVSVNLIYDSWGSMNTSRDVFEMMRRGGVKVQEFNPIRPWECRFSWRPLNRDHRKLLVIDNDIAWLGGMNIASEYAGSWVTPLHVGVPAPWRDNAIGIRGPSYLPFLRAFARSWNYCTTGGRIRRAEILQEPQAEDDAIGILASVPTISSPLRPKLNQLFRQARQSIQLTMAYFAPDDDLINSLCRAARRGVQVQLMLPAKSDVKLLLIAARSFYEKLLSAGVQIFERQTAVLHAKTLCIDRAVTIIGSTNLDYRSIEYNLELSAIIRSRMLGEQMYVLFQNDIGYARQIHLKEWRRRPTADRIGQWAVSRARYLL